MTVTIAAPVGKSNLKLRINDIKTPRTPNNQDNIKRLVSELSINFFAMAAGPTRMANTTNTPA